MAKIDRELFHQYLWRHTDRKGFLRITQQELVKKLQVSQSTMSRLYDELKAEGKLIKHGDRTWKVQDPSISVWNTSSERR